MTQILKKIVLGVLAASLLVHNVFSAACKEELQLVRQEPPFKAGLYIEEICSYVENFGGCERTVGVPLSAFRSCSDGGS